MYLDMSTELTRLVTFRDVPVDATFQIVWEVPGPVPNPPAHTVFTKIAPIMAPLGMANAIYASNDPTQHNLTCIPNDVQVRRVHAPVLTIAEEQRGPIVLAQPALPWYLLPIAVISIAVILFVVVL